MPPVPGLRTPYAKVGRIVYFGRMLDKIRLHAQGRLPDEYVANLGDSKPGVFDTRCCRFLGVPFEEIRGRALQEGSDEEVLEWAESRGGRRSDDDCELFNGFMMKTGWRGPAASRERLLMRIRESGLEGKPIETFFEYIDYDEGRESGPERPWEKV